LSADAATCSSSRSESPISQNIGGHRPTNSARLSAFPRSSWSTVLARIQSAMQRQIVASEAPCICQARTRADVRTLVSMQVAYPRFCACMRRLVAGKRLGCPSGSCRCPGRSALRCAGRWVWPLLPGATCGALRRSGASRRPGLGMRTPLRRCRTARLTIRCSESAMARECSFIVAIAPAFAMPLCRRSS
jgi:hypothetical protein